MALPVEPLEAGRTSPEAGAPAVASSAGTSTGSASAASTERRASLNVPNILSCVRILLVPILVVVLLTKFEGKELVGLGLFLVAAATDFLDGFLARRNKQVTRLGKLLDPAADKILTSAVFISLVGMGRAEAWIVVAIVAREFAISTLRSVAAAENLLIAASWSGKVKTVLQMVAISLLIFKGTLPSPFDRLADLALYLALVATVYSGIDYAVRYARVVWQRQAPPSPEP